VSAGAAEGGGVANTVLLATRNAGKLAELRRMLGGGPVEIVGLADVPAFPDAPETGATFAENALAKARDAAAATGLPAVADDSGLAVEALNGMPGVLSARWSGRHGDDHANLELLLGQLADVPDERRGAAFVCAAALVVPGLVPYAATKGAVKIFTQALSREVGSRGITVNNVQPGPIDTELNPAAGDWAVPQKAATALNRYGHVDEIAAMVAFVAGPESSYITGANLTVDGGMNA